MRSVLFGLVLSFVSAQGFAQTAAPAFAVTKLNDAPATSVEVAGRLVLADRNGMTAYTYDVDAPGVSKCYKGCAVEWAPILVSPNETVAAPFATTARTDGTLQLMYDNQPVYNYDDDKKPGDIKGSEKHGVWHLIIAPK